MSLQNIPTRFYMSNRALIPAQIETRFVRREIPHRAIHAAAHEQCDAVRVTNLLRRVAHAYPHAFGLPNGFDEEQRQKSMKRISDANFNTIICEHAGNIVGSATYTRPRKGVLELFCLIRDVEPGVPPAVGRILLREVLLMTEAKGDKEVVLEVMADPNAPDLKSGAQKLYESVGFVPIRQTVDEGGTATYMHLVGRENIMTGVEALTEQIEREHIAAH